MTAKNDNKGQPEVAIEQLDEAINYLRASEQAKRRYPGLLEILEGFKKFRGCLDNVDYYDDIIRSLTEKPLKDKEVENG